MGVGDGVGEGREGGEGGEGGGEKQKKVWGSWFGQQLRPMELKANMSRAEFSASSFSHHDT